MSQNKPLTDRQAEVYEYIKEALEVHFRPPTVREIGEKFNITSTNGVRSILSALIKKNYIQRTPKVSRGIDLVHKEAKSPKETPTTIIRPDFESKLIEVPILGRVAAGSPILAVENLEGTVQVDKNFLMRQTDVMALRVKGQSMKDAGIFDGDLVFARHQVTAETGQIVVAIIGEEATVKYFYPENGRVRLEPANETFRPIIVDSSEEFRIAGRVIGIQRQIK